MNHNDRKLVETKIYDLSRALKKNSATNCYGEEDIDQFLEVWQELARYYKNSTDTDISVITIREYMRWAHIFGAYAQSQTVSTDCQEISVQARDELSGFIEDILITVADKLDLPD